MRRLLVLALAALLCIGIAVIANYSKQQPASNAVEAPATAAAPLPRQPTAFGINLSTVAYWSKQRAFMNLAVGGIWQSINAGWAEFDHDRIDGNGTVLSLKPGENVAMALIRPPRSYLGDIAIRCRFDGKGVIDGIGMVSPVASPGRLDFIWRHDIETAQFRLNATDPADPIRNIDCREADADPKLLFDSAFVETLTPYKAVRFMDWQQANGNVAGTWSQRTSPGATIQSSGQGVAMEHMVTLANQAKTDPWFVMPWNADATYTENFARYVHDHLDPSLTVYVEVGNEIWNMDFPAGKQARAEGIRDKLSANPDEARMRRYAVKAVAGFKIWSRVYADRPKQLVRILSGQNAWPDLLRYAVDYKDTAANVDALSTAVYFGQQLLETPPADTRDAGPLFPPLMASIDATFASARTFKQMADSHGLRYVAYEGGQHVSWHGADPTLIGRINRDPRMGDAYRKFMTLWARDFGDTLMLFHSVSPPGSSMHFGLADYSGQPISETPKRKAVLDMIAATKGK
ncbi:hypothetical protein [Sphingomonas sp. SRS2]|uniref:hypothetical protein n=1 Tax=Sphingomonas sp. SRS2 TaxID=133190 RepID=UPI000A8A14CD|nr:hypothetical protein [Sphingomonas sp. SRS2]